MDIAMMSAIISLIFFIGIGGRLLPTWMFLNSLQLVVHTPLLSTNMPSNLHYFLVKYLNLLRMNVEIINQDMDEVWQ